MYGLLLALTGCGAPPDAVAGARPVDTAGGAADTARDTADTAADTGRDTAPDTDADGLVGVRLDPPLAAPSFLVENQRREQRTPDWLVGDPSVIWFFRDAGST